MYIHIGAVLNSTATQIAMREFEKLSGPNIDPNVLCSFFFLQGLLSRPLIFGNPHTESYIHSENGPTIHNPVDDVNPALPHVYHTVTASPEKSVWFCPSLNVSPASKAEQEVSSLRVAGAGIEGFQKLGALFGSP